MLERHLLAAIAAGVTTGDEEAARLALGQIDLVLRGFARRRFERELIDATLATNALANDPESARDRLRTAALQIAKRSIPDTEAARTAAYTELAPKAPNRAPIATIAAGLAAVTVAAALIAATVQVVTTDAVAGGFTRPDPDAPVGVFRDGGVPARDPQIEAVLAKELPALLAAPRTEQHDRAFALRSHPAFATRGARLTDAWRGMVDSLERWLDPEGPDNTSELRARVEYVSDLLAAGELGYYLEPALGRRDRRNPGIYTYRIDDVSFTRANDARMRVLGVRRLDAQNDGATMLGLTSEELEDPIVRLDQIDLKVRYDVMPIVFGDRGYWLGDDASRTSAGRRAMMAAAEGIRRELATALGSDLETREQASERIAALLAASIRHHEAQHALDHDRDLPHPPLLALAIEAGAKDPFGYRARNELSAYLSQIASDMWIPQLTLWNLSRHAFTAHNGMRLEEAFVAAIVIEQLAQRLGIRVEPVIVNGKIQRDRLIALVPALAARSTTELRSAAAATWTELFRQKLPRIVDR